MIFNELLTMIHVYSASCLLMGGSSRETVSRYNVNGWLVDLDNLNTGRESHGCTQYTNNDGVNVRMIANVNVSFYHFIR